MTTTAHVDLRQGKVYRVPCKTVAEARCLAKSRYYRPSRIVLVNARRVECYDNGSLVLSEAL